MQREMVLGKMYNVIGDFYNVYQVAILSERQRERCIEGVYKKKEMWQDIEWKQIQLQIEFLLNVGGVAC